ncbi:helix-turn-helix domain-containing protein [Streptomyces sp. B21-083]
MRRNGGNKARTASALGIARATLYRKLRECGA